MRFKEKEIRRIEDMMFIDRGFQFPLSFCLIGSNGLFLTGKLNMRKDGKTELGELRGRPHRLSFPINALFVDTCGKGAHIMFGNNHETSGFPGTAEGIEAALPKT